MGWIICSSWSRSIGFDLDCPLNVKNTRGTECKAPPRRRQGERFSISRKFGQTLPAEIENAQSMLGVTTPSVTGQIDLEVQISGNLIVVREPASLFYAIFSKS